MLKFTPHFSVWVFGPNEFLIICSCAKTQTVIVFTMGGACSLEEYPHSGSMPDVRLMIPSRWNRLPSAWRAAVYAKFLAILEEKFGPEKLELVHVVRGCKP